MAMTRLTSLALMVCGLGAACGEVGAHTPPQPASAQGEAWELQSAYSDEFDGETLDEAKWDRRVASWGVWSWDPENARTEKGLLKLRMQYHEHERQGKKLYYTSGIIKSKASPIKYGYFEARLKAAPLYPGVCPAFWLYRTEKDLWTEMDWELTQSTKVALNGANCFVFRHPRLEGIKALENKRPKISEVGNLDLGCDPRADFHVYGIEWDEETLKWYFDGKLVRTRKNEYWDQPLDVVVSFGLRRPYAFQPSPGGFPTEFEVDYVRVWKKRVPDAGPTPTERAEDAGG